MHLEVLVEDASSAIMREVFLEKILGGQQQYKIHSYKGIGQLPKDLKVSADPAKRILLDN